MKYFLANLSVNLVALAGVGCATYLALNGKGGWGWFLFLAFCSTAAVSFGKSDDNKK